MELTKNNEKNSMEVKKKNTKKAKPVTTTGEVLMASAQEQLVSFTAIRRHDVMNYRAVDQVQIEELAAAIDQQGLLCPLIIWNGSSTPDGAWVKEDESSEPEEPAAILVAGNRRFHAIAVLKKKSPKRWKELFGAGIACRVVYGDVSDLLALKLMENVQREDPNTSELYADVLALKEQHKQSNAAIAKAVGKTPAWVSQLLSIHEELGKEGDSAVMAGEVTPTQARKAASTVRKARKGGKPVSPSAKVKEAKQQHSTNQAAGRKRNAERRVSAKGVLSRWTAISTLRISMARRVELLTQALEYLAEERTVLPPELNADSAVTDRPQKDKASKKKEKATSTKHSVPKPAVTPAKKADKKPVKKTDKKPVKKEVTKAD